MIPYLARALLLLSATLPLHAAITLVDEMFDQPTEMTLRFPPPPGEEAVYHNRFSGWANGKGVLAITYADGLGKNKSGGMLCTIEALNPEYSVVQYGPIRPDFGNLAYVTTAEVGRIMIEFDANIPEGRQLLVHFNIRPPEGMAARVYASRLIFGRAVGTGKFERYTFAASAATPTSLEAFTKFLKDAGLNGATEIELQAVFLLQSERVKWAAGDAFQFDNLKVTLADLVTP